MKPSKSILLVEDNPGDAKFIGECLELHHHLLHPEIVHVGSLAEARQCLASRKVDIILLDLVLPDSTGLETFSRLYNDFPTYPYIVMTGMDDPDLGIESVKQGAQDFIDKNEIIQDHGSVLVRSIRYALERHLLSQRLEQAQALAQIGHWEIIPATNAFLGSKEISNIFGLKTSEFQTLADYISRILPEDQEIVVSTLLEVFKHGGEFAVEHRITHPDGINRHVMMKGAAERDADGHYSKILGTTQDVSERKKVQRLKQEKAIIEESAKLKQHFLTRTNHEIRTPLSPILLLTNILLNENPTAQQREHLNALKSAGEILLAVINDALDLSKIETGKLSFTHRTFRLQQIFSALREMMELNAKEKSLNIIFNISTEIPAYLKGDDTRLTQVLLNLINNAIKFTQKGYIRVEAKCKSVENKSARILFSVSDTGIGMSQQKLQTLSAGLKNLDQGLDDLIQENSLGLMICKQLVKLQGGDIYIDSSEHEGTSVTFEIDFEISQEETMHANILQHRENQDLSGMDILLVEDNPLNQLVTKKILNKWGIQLDIANNGKECIQTLEKKTYSLILMDLQMPVMNGYEATNYIREKMPAPINDIPIIALTANTFSGMNDECIKIGMNDYVAKPFEPHYLNAKIIQHAKPMDNIMNNINSGNTISESIMKEDTLHNLIQNDVSVNSDLSSDDMGTPPYTDLSYLKGISMGDNTIIRKAIERYLKDTPELIDQMGTCLATQDYEQLGKCAHKLKSSVAIMGMDRIKDVMERIVGITRSGAVGNEKLPELVSGSQHVIQHSLTELEDALNEM